MLLLQASLHVSQQVSQQVSQCSLNLVQVLGLRIVSKHGTYAKFCKLVKHTFLAHENTGMVDQLETVKLTDTAHAGSGYSLPERKKGKCVLRSLWTTVQRSLCGHALSYLFEP